MDGMDVMSAHTPPRSPTLIHDSRGKDVVDDMLASVNNRHKIKADDLWLPLSDSEITGAAMNSFVDNIPWLVEGGTTILTSQPGDGKTTLVYPLFKRYLLESKYNYVLLLSELFTAAHPQLRGILDESLHDRLMIHNVAVADLDWLNDILTLMLSKMQSRGYPYKLLLAIDTLQPLMTAWNMDVSSNPDAAQLLGFFKEKHEEWTMANTALASLILHHTRKAQSEDKAAPKGAMGAQALISQCNTRVNLVSDKVADMTSVDWTSQIIDAGEQAYKLFNPVYIGDRKIYTDFSIEIGDPAMAERKESRQTLERYADAAAYYILVNAGEIAGKATQTGLSAATGYRSTVARNIYFALVDDNIINTRRGQNEISLHESLNIYSNTQDKINYVRKTYNLPVATYSLQDGRLIKTMS